jgi:hypothetical protein
MSPIQVAIAKLRAQRLAKQAEANEIRAQHYPMADVEAGSLNNIS